MPPEGGARHLARAEALTAVGRHDDAIGELDQALAFEPQNIRARCTRAMVLYRLQRYDDALAEADRAVGLAPNLAWALRLRALSLLRLDRPPHLVLVAARAAVAADPQDWRSHEVLGDAYVNADRVFEAGQEGRAIATLAPDDAEALIAAARFARHTPPSSASAARGTPGLDGVQLLRRALALDPTNYRATVNLGALLYNFGDRDEALQLFIAAARLEPSDDLATKNVLIALGARGSRALDPETARALEPLLHQQQRAHRQVARTEAIAVLWLLAVVVAAGVGLALALKLDGPLGLVAFGVAAVVAVAASVRWREHQRRARVVQHEVLRRYGRRGSWATRSVELRKGDPATGKRPLRVTWLQIVIVVALVAGFAVSSRDHKDSPVPRLRDYGTYVPPTIPPLRNGASSCEDERRVWLQRLGSWTLTHLGEPVPSDADLFPEGVPRQGLRPRFTVGPAGTIVAVPGGGC